MSCEKRHLRILEERDVNSQVFLEIFLPYIPCKRVKYTGQGQSSALPQHARL